MFELGSDITCDDCTIRQPRVMNVIGHDNYLRPINIIDNDFTMSLSLKNLELYANNLFKLISKSIAIAVKWAVRNWLIVT